MSRKMVSAAEVRAWGRANINTVPEHARGALGDTARGRLHADLVAAFRKANKGKTYEAASDAEKRTVTVAVTALDKAGRKTTRKVTLTTEDARVALGAVGMRGRISLANLSDVLSQREADKVADTFK